MSDTLTRRPVDKRRQKALAILREQRLRVLTCATPGAASRPELIIARVKGHMAVYAIDLLNGRWSCTCLDGRAGDCAHAWAVRLVTGWAEP